MKTYIKLFSIVCAFSFIAACTDKFEELNTSPNDPEAVDPLFLLTSAQELMLDELYDVSINGAAGMVLSQYWMQNEYTEESLYQYRPADVQGFWNNFYLQLKDLDQIIVLNRETPDDNAAISNNQIAVAKILKVWGFQTLTDVFGDIPYFEALSGETNPAPVYTPQSEIYPDLIVQLDSALLLLEPSEGGVGSADLIYNGDLVKWQKFANSLKLRVAMRMSGVASVSALAQSAVEEAANGAFESNNDNAAIQYVGSQPNINPLAESYIERADYSASSTLVDYMLANNDPRISSYFEPAAASGNFIGRAHGQTGERVGGVPRDEVSQLSDIILAPDFEGMLMHYSEVNFILAEAAFNNWDVDQSAEEYYNEGVLASMEYWGVSDEAAAEYLSQNPYNGMQSIAEEKWVSLYMQGKEGWAEWRRLDFGILRRPQDNPLVPVTAVAPQRLFYPLNEASLNGTNYSEAIDRMGGNTLDTKVWWDVN